MANKTLKKVIDEFDALHVNAYTNDQKTIWINELEANIQIEIFRTYPGIDPVTLLLVELTQYEYDTDQNTSLLVGSPYDCLYGMYLACMADFNSREWASYNNEKNMFNLKYLEYANFHNRTNTPKQPNSVKNTWN